MQVSVWKSVNNRLVSVQMKYISHSLLGNKISVFSALYDTFAYVPVRILYVSASMGTEIKLIHMFLFFSMLNTALINNCDRCFSCLVQE